MFNPRFLAATALACAAAVSLSGCAGFTGLPAGGSAGAQSFGTMVTGFNSAVAANCSGGIHVMYMFPAPPQGHIDLDCSPHALPAASPAIQAAAANTPVTGPSAVVSPAAAPK